MSTVLFVLFLVAVVAVVLVLTTGIGGFVKGGKFNKNYGNKLMQARVILQFGAIMLLLIFALLSGGS